VSELVLGVSAAVGASAAAWAWRGRRIHHRTRERLHEDLVLDGTTNGVGESQAEVRPLLRRHRWIAYVSGVAIFALLFFAVELGAPFAVALGVVAAVIAYILELQYSLRRTAALEASLADGIDLMVAALSGGAGLMEAIESAVQESRGTLGHELGEVVGRIRYGERPKDVYEDLGRRVPLETFRLFTFTLAVHGEVGGSLAPAMSTVGRSIRDRIEIARRVRSEGTQAQASVLGILGITWFLGLMMWRTNPAGFEEFLQHPIGSSIVGGAVILQAVGLVWITRMSQIRF
jgi:tight adherence protein B